jgi:hypothetical protein
VLNGGALDEGVEGGAVICELRVPAGRRMFKEYVGDLTDEVWRYRS